jgi:IMP dehydrogenase
MSNQKLDEFFEKMKEQGLRLTYDDVRLETAFSSVLPAQTILTSRFSRHIPLRIPVVSSGMDTVTEARMAIAIASLGGLGIIHKNMSIAEQAKGVRRVKLYLNGKVEMPICVEPSQTLAEVRAMQQQKGFTFDSFPVVAEGALVGMLTGSDFKFAPDLTVTVGSVMTKSDAIISGTATTTSEEALTMMQQHKVSTLPLIDTEGKIAGMYVLSDLQRIASGKSMHNTDKNNHLLVGAAVGAGELALTRAKALVEAGCDVLVIDTAHGWSEGVIDTVKKLKGLYPNTDVVAGNVSRGEGAKALVDAGADGVLVGQGPGSICTTRIVAGVGCPQVSAVYDCVKALEGTGVPVCADGGIQNPGDIAIALAIGASSVILGSILAATDASPGEVIQQGLRQVKAYRGMGSLGAMRENATSRARYGQHDTSTEKLVPEGVESFVPYKGTLADVLTQYVGGVKASMGYLGASNLDTFRSTAELFRITNAGLKESYPHDLVGPQT